ncbi:hypothetical protein [Salinimicrobium sp. TH3]|uniref:hypothetical protein n=1 Tax=Salinimicrobium sp. TH3 TaxID=2997342 RepID=UPI0022731951|nr:hypothetical protein [Salinimicrobium sp. TH3]MCY2688126.1 hypothetical protein [Salinimicrobium sp. TH3]
MAEIKIEKKKPIWPWIILVLVILAILYFLVFADDDDDLDEVETEQVEETTWEEEDAETTNWEDQTDTTDWDTSEGVEGYLAYISDQEKMGIDHQYTNNALIELINAVQAKADDMNYDISADMETVRQEAQAIKSDPMSLTHANTIKSAGTKLANVMEKMQKEEFPNLSSDVTEVKTAAQNIEGSTPTLDQKDQVKKFFDEAGDLLKKMS